MFPSECCCHADDDFKLLMLNVIDVLRICIRKMGAELSSLSCKVES